MAGDPKPDDIWSGLGTGWAVVSTLVAGMLFVGGLGYLTDRLVGSAKIFTAIGVILGAAAGIYLVYLRYGRGESGEG